MGDALTSYFMAKANGRRRRNRIISLKDRDNLIEGDKELLIRATDYYKKLFGPADTVTDVSLADCVPCTLDDVDRDILQAPFSVEEIKDALFEMKHKGISNANL